MSLSAHSLDSSQVMEVTGFQDYKRRENAVGLAVQGMIVYTHVAVAARGMHGEKWSNGSQV